MDPFVDQVEAAEDELLGLCQECGLWLINSFL